MAEHPRNATDKLENLEAEKPKVCPKCKSPYWDTPRKRDKKTPIDNVVIADVTIVKGTPRSAVKPIVTVTRKGKEG